MSMSLYAVCHPCQTSTYIGKDYRHLGYGARPEEIAQIQRYLYTHSTHGRLEIVLDDVPNAYTEWEWDEDQPLLVCHTDPATKRRWSHTAEDECAQCDRDGYLEEVADPRDGL